VPIIIVARLRNMTNFSSLLEEKKLSYDQEIDKLDNLPIPDEHKSVSLAKFYGLVIEHYASILHLCEIGHLGTAFAILRVCREAYMRGSYLHYCAKEKDWDNFHKGKPPANTEIMVKSVQNYLGNKLFCLQDSDFLHDLTHTGVQHISRRNLRTADATIAYSEEETTGLLNCSESFAFLAIASMIDLSSLPEDSKAKLADKIVALHP
jgi:hypothetical protein